MKRSLKVLGIVLMVFGAIGVLSLLVTIPKVLFSGTEDRLLLLLSLLILLAVMAGLARLGYSLFLRSGGRRGPDLPTASEHSGRAAPAECRSAAAEPVCVKEAADAECQGASAEPVRAERADDAESGSHAPVPKEKEVPAEEPMLDDVSYIQDMKHSTAGAWQQYDVLLAARGYGWATMVDWADYMASADLDQIGTLTVAEIANAPEQELIDEFRASGGGLKAFDRLEDEKGELAIGGISRALMAPVKIVWFNQTRVLRFFTPLRDDTLLTKYIETVIRRTFGTADEMKLAMPVPKKEKAQG